MTVHEIHNENIPEESKCGNCNGKGWISTHMQHIVTESNATTCPWCSGTGIIRNQKGQDQWEGVFQGIQLGLDAPLTEEKVREMVGELDWRWIDGGGYEAETPFGTYRVYGYGPVGGGCAKCFLEWSSKRLEKWMVDGMIQEAQKACQRDYEDRVLKALGFEPEKNES